MSKIKVLVIFGGTNTEHEVSLVSAKSIIASLNQQKYTVLPVLINKDKTWEVYPQILPPEQKKQLEKSSLPKTEILPRIGHSNESIDVIFPVLHGPYGEDGTLQGMLDTLRLPYVGCDVLGSAVCMDKVVQKNICQAYSIPITPFLWISRHDWDQNPSRFTAQVKSKLKYPVFVKPANQGSSVGVTKVKTPKSLTPAIAAAFRLDHKILVEEAVNNAREIECSVLGNHNPRASVLGEIVPSNEFYDYDAKYVDGKSEAIIPAPLESKLTQKIRKTAIQAFKVLNCAGLARVDFLLDGKSGKYYLNELNTMPGFTDISMYPKLWQASGLSYQKLLDKLIQLALERYREKTELIFDYKPKNQWHLNK